MITKRYGPALFAAAVLVAVGLTGCGTNTQESSKPTFTTPPRQPRGVAGQTSQAPAARAGDGSLQGNSNFGSGR